MFKLKNLALVVIILVSLSACDVINNAQSMKKMANGNLASKDFLLEIPFEYKNGHIIIEAELAGKKGKFYFDSGAGNILFEDRTETSKFKKIGSLISRGASGETLQMPIVSIASLKIGLAQFNEISFRVFDGFDFQCTDEIIGIIGYSTLRHAHWQIDYENQIIRFSDKVEKLNPVGQKVDLLINSFTYEPQVKLQVNDSTFIRFTFDTGNSGGLLADLESFNQIPASLQYRFEGGKASGLSQSKSITFRDSTLYKVVDGLKLGNVNLSTSIVDYKTPRGLNLLGNKVLENYLVTISWEKKTVWLEPKKSSKPLLANIQYHLIDGAWTLSAIENSTQNKYQLNPGDLLISINGESVENFNLCEPLNLATIFKFKSHRTNEEIEIPYLNLLDNF